VSKRKHLSDSCVRWDTACARRTTINNHIQGANRL